MQEHLIFQPGDLMKNQEIWPRAIFRCREVRPNSRNKYVFEVVGDEEDTAWLRQDWVDKYCKKLCS